MSSKVFGKKHCEDEPLEPEVPELIDIPWLKKKEVVRKLNFKYAASILTAELVPCAGITAILVVGKAINSALVNVFVISV